ncbi:unnamed protein product [Arctia plantaginis]|uniref:Uncharacterized protein n=1 Tax=Arctia plantaginis TaxID=874455 RepID=A0A8S0Z7U8_ARCPL|nr:unnamed protein product [Arctia plantaginis]
MVISNNYILCVSKTALLRINCTFTVGNVRVTVLRPKCELLRLARNEVFTNRNADALADALANALADALADESELM